MCGCCSQQIEKVTGFEISGHETYMDNAIKGHVYVRGHYNDDDCHRDYLQNKNNFGSMTIPFSKCGMRRARM
uniref:ZP domain-containing protein n=1 Tax=Romanomermis culicivorax TaxID=13658 RepID=A0A915JWG4_ROMCU